MCVAPEGGRGGNVEGRGIFVECSDQSFERRGKHFGVWPLAQAAQACFGSEDWPADTPVPQVSIEFDVENPEAMEAAAQELEARGFQLLHGARKEPWGQTVARLLTSRFNGRSSRHYGYGLNWTIGVPVGGLVSTIS